MLLNNKVYLGDFEDAFVLHSFDAWDQETARGVHRQANVVVSVVGDGFLSNTKKKMHRNDWRQPPKAMAVRRQSGKVDRLNGTHLVAADRSVQDRILVQ